jgi:hypothetical protein
MTRDDVSEELAAMLRGAPHYGLTADNVAAFAETADDHNGPPSWSYAAEELEEMR